LHSEVVMLVKKDYLQNYKSQNSQTIKYKRVCFTLNKILIKYIWLISGKLLILYDRWVCKSLLSINLLLMVSFCYDIL
jgi:hypothetical protein